MSMIPKKPAPDLIRGGPRFSEKIMLNQKAGASSDSTKIRLQPANPSRNEDLSQHYQTPHAESAMEWRKHAPGARLTASGSEGAGI